MTPARDDPAPAGGFGLGLDLRGAALPGLPPATGTDANPVSSARTDMRVAALDHRQAHLRNALCRRRAPLTLTRGSARVQALFGPPRMAAGDALWLSVRLDGAPAAIALPPGLARRLCQQPIDAATPDDGALLLEDALSPWLDAAEALTGLSIAFARLAPRLPLMADAVAVTLVLDATHPPERAALAVMLSPDAAQGLGRALRRWDQPRTDLAGMMLRIAIEVDSALLSLAELHSLRPGDALVLEAKPASFATRAIVENHLVAPVAADGPGRWRMLSPLAPRAPQQANMQEDPMTTTPQDPPSPEQPASAQPASTRADHAATPAPADHPEPAPPSQTARLDALEMRLSFRLGEALMSLADLRGAGPGTVITLDRPEGALVDIVVNGQVIGQGDIVTIAGQKACEIRRIFGEG